MIDALLYAWRDALRSLKGYQDAAHCEIVGPDGRPPPRMGDYFVGVHAAGFRSDMDNALNEYFGVALTLTVRLTVPADRVGDQLLAKRLAAAPGPGGAPGMNARINNLAVLFHMNWVVLGAANDWLLKLLPDALTIYGFCEPARFRGADDPSWVSGDWFSAAPDAVDVGLKATLRFEDCRRMQAIGVYS